MTRSGLRRRAIATALATFVVLTAAGTAFAVAPQRELEQRSVTTGTEEVCGVAWDVTSTTASLFMLRAGSPTDPTPLFFFRANYRNVYTDPEDASRGFILEGRSLFRDLDVTRIAGTLYRFEAIDVGATTISSLDGRTVAANRGAVRWTFLVETNGSVDPDGYGDVEVELDGVAGPHGIPGDDEGFCGTIEQINGG
jgi:hypothetical protein